MKVKNISMLLVLILTFLLASCENYVQDFQGQLDLINDTELNSPDQVDFLITGVQANFSDMMDFSVTLSDALGDQFWFTTDVPNATYPSFDEIDDCTIFRDNNSVDTYWNALGFLRFLADDLVDRAENRISFAQDQQELKQKALYWGYLMGGIARYYYAVHFGLHENEGGGVIDKGPFIPSHDMLALAREKFNQALANAPGAYEQRVVNSLIAKTYLVENDYANVKTYAQNGMVNGDDPFQALYSVEDDNYVWQQAGRLRTQLVVDPRFEAYITADPNEASRVQIEPILGNSGATYYRQIKYPEDQSPIPVMTWQENNLMLAEVALLSDNDPATALSLVNEVRTSHGISPLTTIDQNTLIEERDKELFLTGTRVVDMRRFNIPFTSPANPVGPWRYLPVPDNEINANPNISL